MNQRALLEYDRLEADFHLSGGQVATRTANYVAPDLKTMRPWREQDTGWLHVRVRYAKAGVHPYPERGANKLTRPEILAKAAPTLVNRGLALAHPVDGDGNPDNLHSLNVDKYDVGTVIRTEFDGLYGWGEVVIKPEPVIQAVLGGKIAAVSGGYPRMIQHTKGTWEGHEYDEDTTEIVYNHLALVPMGRHGKEIQIELDKRTEGEKSMAKVLIEVDAQEIGEKKFPALKMEVEADEGVKTLLARINEMAAEADAMKKLMAKNEADAKTLKGEADSLRTQKQELETKLAQSVPEAEVDQMVEDLTQIRQVAAHLGVNLGSPAEADWLDPVSAARLSVLDAVHQKKGKKFGSENEADRADKGYIKGAFKTLISDTKFAKQTMDARPHQHRKEADGYHPDGPNQQFPNPTAQYVESYRKH